MKAIVLAAGEGKRLRPLTNDRPKQLVEANGEPLIKWIFAELPDIITEIIMVIGYRGQQLQEYLGEEYEGKKMTYVWQDQPLGTGHALMLCKEHINEGERFLYMFADDIHPNSDIMKLISLDMGMLVKQVPLEEVHKFGVIVGDGRNLVDIVEKPKENPPSNLASTGVFVLDSRIFQFESHDEMGNGERPHTDMIRACVRAGHKIHYVEQQEWIPVGYPGDIPKVEAYLRGGKPHLQVVG